MSMFSSLQIYFQLVKCMQQKDAQNKPCFLKTISSFKTKINIHSHMY